MVMTLLSDACALFFLWIFAQAGLHKMTQANAHYYSNLALQYFNLYQGLNDDVKKAQQLPWLNRAIKAIGAIEFSLALLVVVPSTRTFATVCIIVVLLSYMAMMAAQLYQGKKAMDCGCGGASQLKISGALLVRNLAYCVMALLCLSSGQLIFSSATVVIFVIAFAAISLNLIIEQLIANDQQLKLLNN